MPPPKPQEEVCRRRPHPISYRPRVQTPPDTPEPLTQREAYLMGAQALGIKANARLCESFEDDVEPIQIEYDYSHNFLGDKGCVAVAEALNIAGGLCSLNLHSNGMRDTSARAIAALIQGHANLASVDLSQNQIGNEGAKALVAAIKYSLGLRHLNLSGNPCDPKYRLMIRDFLALPPEKRLVAAEHPEGFHYIDGRGWRYRENTPMWQANTSETAWQLDVGSNTAVAPVPVCGRSS